MPAYLPRISVSLVFARRRLVQALGGGVLLILGLAVSASAGAISASRHQPARQASASVARSTPTATPKPHLPQSNSSTPSTTWYFAEGYTGSSWTEYLTLANFNSVSAHVTVQYDLGSGGPITKQYTVSANSRSTVTVNTDVGANQTVSAIVTSDQPIVAERPLYFTYTALSGYSIPSGTDVLGAPQLGTSFYFDYLDTSTGHDTWLTILNPSGSSMTATIQYTSAAGVALTPVTHTISATSRSTVHEITRW